jgi:hypothetical protein
VFEYCVDVSRLLFGLPLFFFFPISSLFLFFKKYPGACVFVSFVDMPHRSCACMCPPAFYVFILDDDSGYDDDCDEDMRSLAICWT